MVITRNQSKDDSISAPAKSSPTVVRKSPRSRVDATTGLNMGQIITLGLVAAVVLQASLYYLVMNDFIRLHGKATAQSLSNFGPRLEYVLRFQALHVFWLVITTVLVIFSRITTGAVNPLEGFENLILTAKQVHSNSIEQYLMIFVNQLILTTSLAPDLFLRVIPLINVLFFVSRILFWLGYPKYRTAGFMSGMAPISIASLYNLYALIIYLF